MQKIYEFLLNEVMKCGMRGKPDLWSQLPMIILRLMSVCSGLFIAHMTMMTPQVVAKMRTLVNNYETLNLPLAPGCVAFRI